MRYIDLEELDSQIPAEWRAKAQQAYDEVKSLPEKERHDAINARSKIWAELKSILREFSHGKCWYCESKQDRSDNAVDHFRPKNRVADCDGHPGYWWLAFEWHNYRYSCTFCNSRRTFSDSEGGKHDYFPLAQGSFRAWSKADDIEREECLLLDPANANDVDMLWFLPTGAPEPANTNNKAEQERAECSIRLYHLDQQFVVENRKKIYNKIKTLINLGKTFYLSREDKKAKAALEHAKQKLRQAMNERSEFSTAARIYLQGFEDKDHPWIRNLLTGL